MVFHSRKLVQHSFITITLSLLAIYWLTHVELMCFNLRKNIINVLNLSPLQSVRQQYHSDKYQEDRQNQMLVFEKDEIVLDLPTGSSGPKVVDGWKILPLTYPQVKLYFNSYTLMRYFIIHYID